MNRDLISPIIEEAPTPTTGKRVEGRDDFSSNSLDSEGSDDVNDLEESKGNKDIEGVSPKIIESSP